MLWEHTQKSNNPLILLLNEIKKMSRKQDFADKLRKILAIYSPILNAIENDEFKAKPFKNKWSKIEILGHLIDSAHNNYYRFTSAEKNPKLFFQGYDQVAWVEHNQYQKRDKTELLNLFLGINYHIAFFIESMDEKILHLPSSNHNFDTICMKAYSKNTPVCLANLVDDYLFHLEHHLKQIAT